MAHAQLAGEINQLNVFLRQLAEKTMRKVEDSFESASEGGVTDIRRSIETTPSGIVDGKANRIWTGNMWESVSSDMEITKDAIRAWYGWLGLTEEEAEYIFLQEYGGERVSFGMHSLFKSFKKRVQEIKRDLT